jgi:hypothetical protein
VLPSRVSAFVEDGATSELMEQIYLTIMQRSLGLFDSRGVHIVVRLMKKNSDRVECNSAVGKN